MEDAAPGPRWKRPAVVAVAALVPTVFVLDCAPKMYPRHEGTSADFWFSVCGAEIDPKKRHEGLRGWPGRMYPPRDGCFIYRDQLMHSEDIFTVRIDEAVADLPEVVSYLDGHFDDESICDAVRLGFRSWTAADPSGSDAVLFIGKLREAYLAGRMASRPRFHDYALARERAFDERWKRMRRYWLNVVFECLWLAGVVVCALWPWLRRARASRWGLHIGLVPFLLFLPYFLGYCVMAMTSAGPVGGVLYPWLILYLHSLGPCLGSGDVWLLENTPKLLMPLSQGSGGWLSISGFGCIGPLGSLLVGGFAGGLAFGAAFGHRKWRARHPAKSRPPLARRTKVILASAAPVALLVYLVCLWVFVPDRLHEAAYRGDVARVRGYLESGADPNEPGQTRRSIKFLGVTVWYVPRRSSMAPLHYAIIGRRSEVVDAFLQAGVDLEVKDDSGHTALFAALFATIWHKDFGTAEKLLAAGAVPNVKGSNGWGTLHLAALSEQPAMALALIERGLDVNARARDGRTPLHFARNADVLAAILEKGADPRTVDDAGNTLLHWHTDVAIIQLLVKAGVDANARNKGGGAPLHAAAGNAREARTLHALVDAGADVGATDAEGNTPLHLAWMPYTIEALLEAGADMNAKNKDGETPLHLFARSGQLKHMKALIAAGADPTITNAQGLTPLGEAKKRENAHPLVIEFLKNAEARRAP